MPGERIIATYRAQTTVPLEKAAAVLAGEQSSGTFVAVPGETDELRTRFAARVEKITPTDDRAGGIVVSWPIENVGQNLAALISTIAGNLFELREFDGIKLLDFDVPASFGERFRGPMFGIDGTRRLTDVRDRPLIGTIIKPSVGLSPAQTAELVATLAGAGIDFIKDDELMADPPHSPIEKRVDAVMRVINEHADRSGKKVMYAFNISDELDAMLRHYETVRSAGGTAVMVSLNSVGLAGVKMVCDLGALAVHGHRNGWGMLNRSPTLGVEFPAYQKLWRLAGVDQIHVNGIANKFWESDDSVVRSIEACLTPLCGLGVSPEHSSGAILDGGSSRERSGGAPKPQVIMPVISSGQTGLQAPETYRRTKTIDVLYLAGGGIMAHPSGPAAGVAALRQAWEAAVKGVELSVYAKTHPELRQQIEKFGGRT